MLRVELDNFAVLQFQARQLVIVIATFQDNRTQVEDMGKGLRVGCVSMPIDTNVVICPINLSKGRLGIDRLDVFP